MVANVGDLKEVDVNNPPVNFISVFITGFAIDTVQEEDTMFKSIKIAIIEFIRSGSVGKNFKCRYLKSDDRIDKKLTKAKKTFNLLITGELTYINSEFQVDIQDVNFLPTSIVSLESSTNNVPSSQYSWSTQTSERFSAQAMANASLKLIKVQPTPHRIIKLTQVSVQIPQHTPKPLMIF